MIKNTFQNEEEEDRDMHVQVYKELKMKENVIFKTNPH